MNRVVLRNFVIAATWISVVPALPAALFLLLIALNTINPFQTMFVTSFTVRNESGEALDFWVLGTHESGTLGLLPLFATSVPPLPSPRETFSLADKTSTDVIYDWDDFNFGVILVRRANREYFSIDVDTDDRRSDCCYRHRSDQYVIPPVRSMRPATPIERSLVEDSSGINLRLAAVYWLPFLPLLLYFLQRQLR